MALEDAQRETSLPVPTSRVSGRLREELGLAHLGGPSMPGRVASRILLGALAALVLRRA
jgi:hypothetical protein